MEKVEEEIILDIPVQFIYLDEKRWYFLGRLINTKPSVYIARNKISSNNFLILNEQNCQINSLKNQYVVTFELLINIFAKNDKHAIKFVQFYFETIQKRKPRNFFSKLGRKRKKFKDLKGKSNILKRRKEIDNLFYEKHSISINQYVLSQNLKFLPSLPNYPDIRNYIFDNNNGTLILKKIPIEKVILAKDKSIISYKKLTILRKTLLLQKYLPSTDTILKKIRLINQKICERYQIEIKNDCIVLNNIELFITDYVRVIKKNKKNDHNDNFLLKWSCDQRTLLNNCGNVGVSIQLLEDSGNQDPHRVMYICIGNGKEDLSFFQSHMKKHQIFCSKLIEDKYYVDQTTITNFFLADLKHLWENCYLFEGNKVLQRPLFPGLLPFESDCHTNEFSIMENSESDLGGLLTHSDISNSDQLMENEIESDYDDDDDVINYKGVYRKCLCCGKNQEEIREFSHKESLKFKKTLPQITVKHWLGIPVKFFCLLHCSQRCTERILFLISQNDESKCTKITDVLKNLNIIRKTWNFRWTRSGRFYPQMIFGDEVRLLLSKLDQFFAKLKWLKKRDIDLLQYWKIVYDRLHLTSKEIQTLQMDNQLDSIQLEIDQMIFHMIKFYGRESIQFYFHYIDFHFIDMIKSGISLCIVQQQAVEHSHSLHKTIQRNMSSNESGFHRTPSFYQIFMRQMRIFVIENNLLENILDELNFINNLVIDEELNLI